MKLPSLAQALGDARETFVRFPLVLTSAIIGTCAALILVDFEGPPGPSVLFNILLATALGIPLLVALKLLAEKWRWTRAARLGVQALGVLLLALYALTVPANLAAAPALTLIRFAILAVALHLLVAVLPFSAKGERNAFWQFNTALFLRILTALLFSFVLWVGLAIALKALETLFGLQIPGKRFPELWILINGIFATWYFLAGVPADIAALEASSDYPKALRIFAEYILLPLVFVYLVILYAYAAKVVISWEWPEGWVSKLILGFSGAGILSLLLLQPAAEKGAHAWIRRASRWFSVALAPLIVLLFFAVWRRVSEYGMTEGRYCAIALGVWLAVMAVYFTISSVRSLKVIPASLCVLAIAVAFGPWGAAGLSEQSQVSRLRGILERNGMLSGGAIVHAGAPLPARDASEISAILRYLHEIHGYDAIQAWFSENLRNDTAGAASLYQRPEVVAQMMGVEYSVARMGFSILKPEKNCAFDIRGYQGIVRVRAWRDQSVFGRMGAGGLDYRFSQDTGRLTFSLSRDSTGTEVIGIDIGRHAADLLRASGQGEMVEIPAGRLAIGGAGGGFSILVCPWEIAVERRGGEFRIAWFDAEIAYRTEGEG